MKFLQRPAFVKVVMFRSTQRLLNQGTSQVSATSARRCKRTSGCGWEPWASASLEWLAGPLPISTCLEGRTPNDPNQLNGRIPSRSPRPAEVMECQLGAPKDQLGASQISPSTDWSSASWLQFWSLHLASYPVKRVWKPAGKISCSPIQVAVFLVAMMCNRTIFRHPLNMLTVEFFPYQSISIDFFSPTIPAFPKPPRDMSQAPGISSVCPVGIPPSCGNRIHHPQWQKPIENGWYKLTK